MRRTKQELKSSLDELGPKVIQFLLPTYVALPINKIPLKFRTREVCEHAFAKNPLAVEYIPQEFITSAMCQDAINRQARSYSYLPQEFRTMELFEQAFDLDVFAILHPPTGFEPGKKMWLRAVAYDEDLFSEMPKKFLTKDFIYKLILRNSVYVDIKTDLGLTTQEMLLYVLKFGCAQAIIYEWRCYNQLTPKWQKFISEHSGNLTQAEYKKALQMQTSIYYALRKDASFFRNLDKVLLTEKFCILAIKSNWQVISYMRDEYISLRICRLALRANARAWDDIPDDIRAMPELLKDLADAK